MINSTLATEDQRHRQAQRVTWASILINVVLTVVKLFAGIFGASAAMIADAIHSASDFATDFAVLIGMRLARRPQDEDHPYGHGKYETLAAVIIGISLCGVGVSIAMHAVHSVYLAFIYDQWPTLPSLYTIVVGAISVVVKEFLYQWTAQIARRSKNDALLANAWHHRSDALSSVAAVIGITVAILLGGHWVLLDNLIAFLIGGILIVVAWKIVAESLDKLLEHGMSEEENKQILELILSVPNVVEPHHLRSRRVGIVAVIEIHFRVDPQMTVIEGHTIATQIEDLLHHAFGADAIITLHVEPIKQVIL